MKYGAKLSSFDIRDYRLVACDANYEKEYMRRLLPVKDQGPTPQCTAFAAALIAEDHYAKHHGEEFLKMSNDYIYLLRDLDYYLGDGMSARDAMQTLLKHGCATYKELPGNHNYEEGQAYIERYKDSLKDSAYEHHITSYYIVKNDNEVKHSVRNNGMVLAVIPIYSMDFVNDEGIFVQSPTFALSGYHSVAIYGWNEKGWLVQNSWGDRWGKNGRCVLPYGSEIRELWCSVDTYKEGEFKRKFTSPIGKIAAVIINFLVNLLRRMLS